MILGRYLDTQLEVLPDVGRQHGPQTLQRVVDGQRAEEVDQPLGTGSERRHRNEPGRRGVRTGFLKGGRVHGGVATPPQTHLGVEQMRVHHGSLDVVQVGVVLQRSLQQARLLTQLSDVGPVVVGEHLVPQDRVCYLKKKKHTQR